MIFNGAQVQFSINRSIPWSEIKEKFYNFANCAENYEYKYFSVAPHLKYYPLAMEGLIISIDPDYFDDKESIINAIHWLFQDEQGLIIHRNLLDNERYIVYLLTQYPNIEDLGDLIKPIKNIYLVQQILMKLLEREENTIKISNDYIIKIDRTLNTLGNKQDLQTNSFKVINSCNID